MLSYVASWCPGFGVESCWNDVVLGCRCLRFRIFEVIWRLDLQGVGHKVCGIALCLDI